MSNPAAPLVSRHHVSHHILRAGLMTLGLLAAPAFAADPVTPPATSGPSSAPPAGPVLDAGPEIRPEIRPDRQNGDIKDNSGRNTTKLTEKRVPGKATEVEVKKGKNTYYVKPNNPNDPDARGIRGAQWKVGEFGGPKSKDDASATSSADATSKTPARRSALKSKTPVTPPATLPAESGPDSLSPPVPLETK